MSPIRVGRQAGAAVMPNPLSELRNRAGGRQLDALADDQLRDLGIARAEMARVARQERTGPPLSLAAPLG